MWHIYCRCSFDVVLRRAVSYDDYYTAFSEGNDPRNPLASDAHDPASGQTAIHSVLQAITGSAVYHYVAMG